jgi:hypothetical protein
VVSKVATTRLIDASAALEPADRALVNLWVNRGLDDAAVARMTHMSDSAIAERRGRIVQRLGLALGLSAEDVGAALVPVETPPAVTNGAGATDAPAEALVDAPAETADAPAETAVVADEPAELAADAPAEPTADAPADPAAGEPEAAAAEADGAAETATTSRRRRPLLVALVGAAAAVVLVIVLTSGSRSGDHRAVTAPGSASATVSTQSVSTTVTPTSPPTTAAPTTTTTKGGLAPLPGGLTGVTGVVSLKHKKGKLTLNLSVSHLRPSSHGHYEAWLYNSLLSAEPIGRLHAGVNHLALRLPRDAKRYRWIDVSFQPLGDTYHSGESLLRAANPAH